MAGYGNYGYKTQAAIEEAFRERKDGKWGTLEASTDPYTHDSGRLRKYNEDAWEEFRVQRASDNIAYVVWSYVTPIAWVCKDGTVHHVTERFSQTTTGQQTLARRFL